MKRFISETKHLKDYSGEATVYMAVSTYPEHLRMPLHSHDFYELFILLEGTLSHNHNGKTTVLTRGGMKLIHPLDIHTFEGKGVGVNRLLNLAFTEGQYKQLLEAYGVETTLSEEIRLLPDQVMAYKNRLALVDGKKLSIEQMLKGMFFDYYCANLQRTSRSSQKVIPPWLKKAMNLMMSQDNLALGFERFVELTGKSKEHVSRTMHTLFAITPGRWINEHRLDMARTLLKTTDMTVLAIVYEVGFNSESYFYRLYKSTYGVTPHEDRNATEDER